MPAPATIPWLLALGTAATLGGIYYFTRDEEEEEEAEGTPDDGRPDEEKPTVPPKPGPGGLKEEGTGLPSEPVGGWNSYLTPLTANQALEEVRTAESADNADAVIRQALQKVFPVPEWEDPLSQWQKDARTFMWDQLRALAQWDTLVAQGAPLDAPYTFWLRRHPEMTACRTVHTDDAAVAKCTAEAIFSALTWPPPADAEQWQTTVWQQLLQQAAAG